MNKEDFKKQFKNAETKIDKKQISKMVKDSLKPVNNRDGILNAIIVMEELSELSIEVSKAIREKDNKMELLEEMADVELGMYYLMEIFDITEEEFNKAINVKMKRQIDRNKNY